MQFTLLTNLKIREINHKKRKYEKHPFMVEIPLKTKKELHLIKSICGKPRAIITHFLW